MVVLTGFNTTQHNTKLKRSKVLTRGRMIVDTIVLSCFYDTILFSRYVSCYSIRPLILTFLFIIIYASSGHICLIRFDFEFSSASRVSWFSIRFYFLTFFLSLLNIQCFFFEFSFRILFILLLSQAQRHNKMVTLIYLLFPYRFCDASCK